MGIVIQGLKKSETCLRRLRRNSAELCAGLFHWNLRRSVKRCRQ